MQFVGLSFPTNRSTGVLILLWYFEVAVTDTKTSG